MVSRECKEIGYALMLLIVLFSITVPRGLSQTRPAPGTASQVSDDRERISALESLVTELNSQLRDLSNSTKQRFSINPPIGSIVAFAGPKSQIPENWRVCNGDSVTQTTYPLLWLAIGNTWGGTGPGDFKLPNLGGRFLRGVDDGAGVDPGREVGTPQADAIKHHGHTAKSESSSDISPNPHAHSSRVPGGGGCSGSSGCNQGLAAEGTSGVTLNVSTSTKTTIDEFGGSETRPVNAAVYWIIKVKDTIESAAGVNKSVEIEQISVLTNALVSPLGTAQIATASNVTIEDTWQADVERMLQEFLSCAEVGDDRSPCNVFLARALDRVYKLKEFGDPTKPSSIMKANQIADYVAVRTDLWLPLGTAESQDSLNQAQEYANQGKAIIAVWKNPIPNGHGHVALILPGQMSSSTTWQMRVPNSAAFSLDAPRESYVGGPLSKAFGAAKKAQVKIYGHL